MSLDLLAIDLGKQSFHIHGIDSDGVIISRKISRAKLIGAIEELAPAVIAMEACASAHYWGRRFLAAGHQIRLINPRFVSRSSKDQKTTRRMPKEFTKQLCARRCVSCRSNRLNNRTCSRFIVLANVSFVLEPPLSTICEDCSPNMVSFYPRAPGASRRK